MIRKATMALIGSVALTGCFNANTSQAPIATTYTYSEQQKMQAAHHWNVLAAHEAAQILNNERLSGRTFHLENNASSSPFNDAFNSLLTSQLVNNNAVVTLSSLNSLSINYKVQIVEHSDRDNIRYPQGALTALAAGIAVATLPYNNWSEPSLALIPAAGIIDIFSGSWTSETDHEVIITTQVTDSNTILHSTSNIYYINGGDKNHYKTSRPAGTVNLTDQW